MNNNYANANVCIYCGNKENLSNEHLLAYSLGGTEILKKASCEHHRNVTSAFELNVARAMYRNFRDVSSVQSRRKKDGRQDRLEADYKLIGERYDGTKVEFRAPLKEVPLVNAWISFTQIPTIINDGILNSPLGISFIRDDHQSNALRFEKLLAKTGFKTISVTSTPLIILAPEYFQMLAKTVHSYLWAERRGEGYTPLLLNMIEGADKDFPRLIGCDDSLPRSDKQFELHEVSHAGENYLVVHITLRDFPSTPRYLIVSGRCL
jgi:hypothetical protein